MPHSPDRRTLVMSVVLLQRPRAFEVPEEELTIAVPAADETSIGADGDIAGVTGDIVTLHLPLSLERVPLPCLVDDDAIVEALADEELLAGVHSNHRHGVHRWVGDVLDWDADVPLPNQHC
jgi:hypothetical protein